MSAIAREFGTPTIVFCEAHLRGAAREYLCAFADYPGGVQVAYASKALPNTGILRIMADEGLGADVASGGELAAALRAGVSPETIVVHGNNKSRAELAEAVDAGVGLIVIDAPDELDL